MDKHSQKKIRMRFETARKQVDKAQREAADVKAALPLLGEAEQYLKKGEEYLAVETLDNIDIIIKEAKAKKKYEMMILNSRPILDKAKRSGADISESETLLSKAQELLDNRKFGEAHELIKKARLEADKAKHFVMARVNIQQVAPLIEAAKKRGVNVQEATKAIVEAWDSLNQGNYDVVASLIKRAMTVLEIAEEQKGFEVSIRDMEARIATVAESGVDTKGMAGLLAEAKTALENERYGDVKTSVNKIRREIEKVILQREAGLTLRTIQQFVREAKRAGIKSAELEEMLEKASVAVKTGNYTQIRSIELSAKQAVKNLKLFDSLSAGDIGVIDKEREEGFISLIGETLADSRNLVERARASGIGVSNLVSLIDEAERALAGGKLKEAFEFARQVSRLIHEGGAEFQMVETKKNIEEICSTLEEAKLIGINVDDAETLASQTRAMLETGRPGDIAESLQRTKAALDETIRNGAAGRHPRLKVSVRSDGAEAKRWNRASIELSNIGNSVAKNIDMSFFGDVEVRDWTPIPKLLPGQNSNREIALRTHTTGKIPLDMTVCYEKSFDATKFQLNDMKDIDVAESGAFIVEDAFLIHNSGILISKQTRRIREEVDGDIFSAMLTAVSQFAKDSFNLAEKVALNRMEFGDNLVMIERGESFYIAITIQGRESVYMPFYLSEIVREIESKYGDILRSWEGNMKMVEGVHDIVKNLLMIRRTENGTPDLKTSILHPALEALDRGVSVPNFENDIKALLTSFEEDLISGEMEDTGETLERIQQLVSENANSERQDPEQAKMNTIVKESLTYETESVRAAVNKLLKAGADVAGEERMLEDSFSLLESGEFEKARRILTDVRALLKEKEMGAASENLAKQLEELKSALKTASGMGVEITDIETMADEAENLLAKGASPDIDAHIDRMATMLRNKTGGFMANRYPKLRVEVHDAGGHEAGNWSKMDVVVSNTGNTPARNIDLNFSGDIEVKHPELLDAIDPNGSKSLEISLKPSRTGNARVEVSASYQRFFDDTKYQLNDLKELDVQMPGSYIVKDAFLIHNSGLLIAHETRRIKEEVDSDIFSAMLMALTDFVRQAFNISNRGGLDRMEFGGEKLLIEKGKFVFLAITVSGEESRYIPFFMTEVIGEIEKKYSGVLEDWGGDMKPLDGVQDIVQKIIFVKKTGEEGIPILKSSVLTPALDIAAGGHEGLPEEFEGMVGRISEIVNEQGIEAAQQYVSEMEERVGKITGGRGAGQGRRDSDILKKRIYDIVVRSGHMDGALMDARLENYLEVASKISDAVLDLRKKNGIPEDQILAGVAVKHPDHERWSEAVGNIKSLVLEQTKSLGIRIMNPEEIWDGLEPAVEINEEQIRNSYKFLAKKIINILQYMPPDKLNANILKGTFTIGVEGQQVYISGDMVSLSFSLPAGAFEAPLDSGVIYIDTRITEEAKSDASVGLVVEKIKEMRRELDIEEGAMVEVQIFADDDGLAELLEKAKELIKGSCGAYDVALPLDDPFGAGEYYTSDLEINGAVCTIGIVQVELEE
jgi:hypothetical protein